MHRQQVEEIKPKGEGAFKLRFMMRRFTKPADDQACLLNPML